MNVLVLVQNFPPDIVLNSCFLEVKGIAEIPDNRFLIIDKHNL